MKKYIVILLISLVLTSILCGCNYDSENYVFGTYYSINIKGKNARSNIKEVETLLEDLDKTISTNILDSDVYRINEATASEKVKVSSTTISLFKLSKDLYYKTNGAFNPAVYPLVELWAFSPNTYTGIAHAIPNENTINDKLAYCDIELFIIDENESTITKQTNEAKIDFGGIGKGFAVDLAYEKVKDADHIVIDIGRTIKVKQDTTLFVADPRGGDFVAKATLSNQSVATSGDYERYYILDGVRYHHIIDNTGYPANLNDDNAIISATIVGESAMLCDAMSTASLILGYSECKPLLESMGLSALLLTENGYYTVGEEKFEILDTTRQKLN